MEFEQDKQFNDEIDSMTRLAASTRQLTISPIHNSVTPEQISRPNTTDSSSTSIPSETETTLAVDNHSTLQEITERNNHRLALAVSAAIMALMTIGLYYAYTLNR